MTIPFQTDIRRWLIPRLVAYGVRWPKEDATDLCRKFVESQPGCFESDCFDDGHITGSAWVLCPQRQKVLLTHHRKLNKWLQLGGHSDGESNTLNVALREATEESGINVRVASDLVFDIDIHAIPSRGTDPEHNHYDVRFVFEADEQERLVVSAESNDLRWVPLSKIEEFTTEESILRMVRKTTQFGLS